MNNTTFVEKSNQCSGMMPGHKQSAEVDAFVNNTSNNSNKSCNDSDIECVTSTQTSETVENNKAIHEIVKHIVSHVCNVNCLAHRLLSTEQSNNADKIEKLAHVKDVNDKDEKNVSTSQSDVSRKQVGALKVDRSVPTKPAQFPLSINNSSLEDESKDKLDDDKIKTSPAFIPKAGQFYMHDIRFDTKGLTTSATNTADEAKEPAKLVRKNRADVAKWGHDLYNENRQQPKTSSELARAYGHNMRRSRKVDPVIKTNSASRNRRRDVTSDQVEASPTLINDNDKKQSTARALFEPSSSTRSQTRISKNGGTANVPSRGHVRIFRRTQAPQSTHAENTLETEQQQWQRPRSDKHSAPNRQVQRLVRRNNDENNINRSTVEFRNLNISQQLSRREACAQRDTSRRVQQTNIENHLSVHANEMQPAWSDNISHIRYIPSMDQTMQLNYPQVNSNGPILHSMRPLHTVHIPYPTHPAHQPPAMINAQMPPPRLIGTVPYLQSMPLGPPMMQPMHPPPPQGTIQLRQPTHVVYFNTDTQLLQRLAPK